MTLAHSLYDTYKRYRTLQSDRIHALPIVILMPHSACNCRCVMCDIWKDNRNLKQLTEKDISGLLHAFRLFGTQQVVMSGGEALLNPQFFRLCEILKNNGIAVTLLSTGLTIGKNAAMITRLVKELILSLDGDETTHDRIRNIQGAFNKLQTGIASIRALEPGFRITGRTVIHRLNFRCWPRIIDAARQIGLNQVSFLPADVSSQAFNREVPWNKERQHEILPGEQELPAMEKVIRTLFITHKSDFDARFIAESPSKIEKIFQYYNAIYGKSEFPYKKCNAPWVSTVIEADGTVRPCFFHAPVGNIRENKLEEILNGDKALSFRKELNMEQDNTCRKCVCYLHLSPQTKFN
jgi:Fe-coproporphyrin III synthase